MHNFRVLLKFISREEYVDDFLNGNFYMNLNLQIRFK